MSKTMVSIFALGLFGYSANAASLTNKEYKTPHEAAKAAAVFTLDKTAGSLRYSARNLCVTGTFNAAGDEQLYIVVSDDQQKSLAIHVKQEPSGKYRAYIPTRYVFTAYNA